MFCFLCYIMAFLLSEKGQNVIYLYLKFKRNKLKGQSHNNFDLKVIELWHTAGLNNLENGIFIITQYLTRHKFIHSLFVGFVCFVFQITESVVIQGAFCLKETKQVLVKLRSFFHLTL